MEQFADIVLPLHIDSSFTYRIPRSLIGSIQVGMRILVPFGKRKLTGYVIRLHSKPTFTTVKPIEDVLDDTPAFAEDILQLAHWMSEYYLCPLGEVLKAALPAGIKLESERRIQLAPDFDIDLIPRISNEASLQLRIVEALRQKEWWNLKQLQNKLGSKALSYTLRQLEKRGVILISQEILDPKVKPKIRKFVRLCQEWQNKAALSQAIEKMKARSPKQAAILALLKGKIEEVASSDLLKRTNTRSSTLKRLAEAGFVEIFNKEVYRDYYNETPKPPPNLTLNPDQTHVFKQIKDTLQSGKFKTFLLHGVTASGKTQVYIEALKIALSQGKGAIVLVPEISLTPQTVRRFQSNFPNQIAVLHSRMSQGERYDSWRRLKSGEFRIAVGARSAIFAPIKNIGLIVVDEEQEASYKQFEPNPLYHARDVAVMRAKINGAVTILGSATPSAESYYNAINGKYHYLSLPSRIDDIPMPSVRLVDMMREHRVYGLENSRVFSHLLKKKIQEKLDLNEQIILLQNRRGYASYLKCKACGYVEQCINCNITLTYHKKFTHLRCHYCGFTKRAPEKCPECGGHEIQFKGVGTQKVEEELKTLFPEARIVRMDLDTTRGKLAHDRIIISFGEGKYDILLGTQMVAKGLDFHRVTLVGVISADTGLLLPDFRASERTFQLLTQVAGRAGRKDRKGEVIVQTYSPENETLLFAQKHNFIGYYDSEKDARRELYYPPYGRLANILFKGTDEKAVIDSAEVFARKLKPYANQLILLGPTPSPLSKIQNQFRWQIVIKSPREMDPAGKRMRDALKVTMSEYKKQAINPKVKIYIDIDPISMF